MTASKWYSICDHVNRVSSTYQGSFSLYLEFRSTQFKNPCVNIGGGVVAMPHVYVGSAWNFMALIPSSYFYIGFGD